MTATATVETYTTTAVNTAALRKALTFLKQFIPKHHGLPLMRCVQITGELDSLVLRAFDYETDAEVRLDAPGANFGTVLVDLNDLLLAIKPHKAAKSDTTEIHVDHRFSVEQGPIGATMDLVDGSEYPESREISGDWYDVSADLFDDIVTFAVPAAGVNDMLPVLTGVLVKTGAGYLSAEATDRFRLAEVTGPIVGEAETRALIPASLLARLAKFRPGIGFTVHVEAVDDYNGWATFEGGDLIVRARLLDGQFPRVEQLFPAECEHEFTVDAQKFAPIVKGIAGVLPNKGTNPMPVEVDKAMVTMSGGGASGHVECEANGEFRAAFEARYLHPLVSAHFGKVTMRGNSPTKPWLIEGEDRPNVRALIMPVREG